mgnify:CR=1 FL=1
MTETPRSVWPWTVLAFVVLLVFAYTQAIRQVKLSKDLSLRLREQLTVAREQVAREGGKVETAHKITQETKADLPTPWPEATATLIA